ncbi:hypothetical protein PIB30_050640, partial [Stylosanthes scabra]|nr:hypothetical protein [Stylosanthes scabra]
MILYGFIADNPGKYMENRAIFALIPYRFTPEITRIITGIYREDPLLSQVRLLNPTTLHALGELPNPYLVKLCWRTPTFHINLQPSVLAPPVTPIVPNPSK